LLNELLIAAGIEVGVQYIPECDRELYTGRIVTMPTFILNYLVKEAEYVDNITLEAHDWAVNHADESATHYITYSDSRLERALINSLERLHVDIHADNIQFVYPCNVTVVMDPEPERSVHIDIPPRRIKGNPILLDDPLINHTSIEWYRWSIRGQYVRWYDDVPVCHSDIIGLLDKWPTSNTVKFVQKLRNLMDRLVVDPEIRLTRVRCIIPDNDNGMLPIYIKYWLRVLGHVQIANNMCFDPEVQTVTYTLNLVRDYAPLLQLAMGEVRIVDSFREWAYATWRRHGVVFNEVGVNVMQSYSDLFEHMISDTELHDCFEYVDLVHWSDNTRSDILNHIRLPYSPSDEFVNEMNARHGSFWPFVPCAEAPEEEVCADGLDRYFAREPSVDARDCGATIRLMYGSAPSKSRVVMLERNAQGQPEFRVLCGTPSVWTPMSVGTVVRERTESSLTHHQNVPVTLQPVEDTMSITISRPAPPRIDVHISIPPVEPMQQFVDGDPAVHSDVGDMDEGVEEPVVEENPPMEDSCHGQGWNIDGKFRSW
jgi:hypothetical protein